jgi:hypothetical protein
MNIFTKIQEKCQDNFFDLFKQGMHFHLNLIG